VCYLNKLQNERCNDKDTPSDINMTELHAPYFFDSLTNISSPLGLHTPVFHTNIMLFEIT